jgi:hypothetical protein
VYNYTPDELGTVLGVFSEKLPEYEKEADVAAQLAYWRRTKEYLQAQVHEGKL